MPKRKRNLSEQEPLDPTPRQKSSEGFDSLGGLFHESAVQCKACIRFIGWVPGGPPTFTCGAFPAGIPADILDGRVSHLEPFPGDGGKRFSPRGVALTADDIDLL